MVRNSLVSKAISLEVRGRRGRVEEIGSLGRAGAAGFRIRVMLAEVVLLMRGPFVT